MRFFNGIIAGVMALAAPVIVSANDNTEHGDWLLKQQSSAQNAIELAQKEGWLDDLEPNKELSEKYLKIVNEIASNSKKYIDQRLADSIEKNEAKKNNKSLLDSVDGALFLSFSMPRQAIIESFKVAKEHNLTIILNGLIRGTKTVKPTMLAIQTYSAAAKVEPKVGIDPTEFEAFNITSVPTVVLRTGATITKVAGNLDIEHIKETHESHEPNVDYLDMGVEGQIFDIDEVSIVETMKETMANIDWENKKKLAVQNFWKKYKQGELPDSHEEKQWVIDPTVRITKDITNSQGEILARAGEVVNPLKQFPVSLTILIINASKPEQIKWAKDNITSQMGMFQIHIIGVDKKDGWNDLARIRNDLGAPVFMMPEEVKKKFFIEAVPSIIKTRPDGMIQVQQVNVDDLVQPDLGE